MHTIRGRSAAHMLVCVVLLLASTAAVPPTAASPEDLRLALSRFAASPEGTSLDIGVSFLPADPRLEGDPRGGGSSVSHGADRPLIPASVTKLVTTSAVLDRFGPRHTFDTRLSTTGRLVDGVLSGDLCVRGAGDPFLVTERLWLLGHLLHQTGLREVRGRLVIDESQFAPEDEDPSRVMREISDRPYAARLTPLAINFNTIGIRVDPGKRAGDDPIVEVDPVATPYLRIESGLRTVPAPAAAEWTLRLLPASRGETDSLGTFEIASLTGGVEAGGAAQLEYRSAREPGEYSAGLLRAFLRESGISIAGPTTFAATPPDAVLLLEFPSLPLEELVASANRYSNNFMADLLCMSLADSGATLSRGAEALREWVEATIAVDDAITLYDGSGLDPRNRLTARLLARVLQRMWGDLASGPALAASLPAPGEDGTMRRRFGRDPIGSRIRAKTGTLGDARTSCLAGLLEADSGPVAFALLMNGRPGSTWTISRMQDLQDEWIRLYLR